MSFFDDASLVFLPSGQAGKDGKAYSMKPTNGDGDFTFSRGSNLTATRIDSNGLIEKGRENLLTYSNDFSNVAWTKFGTITLTSGQSGYDGSSDAWLYESETSTHSMLQYLSGSSVYTYSVYAKAGTADGIRLRVDAATDTNIYVDLTDGSIITDQSGITYNIESVGSGWYRVSITSNVSTLSNVRLIVTNNAGAQTAGTIYIQDAQLEIGLTATEPIESGATTGKAGLLENEPRFDFSGGASCPSLLLEPSRTQLAQQSEFFEGSEYSNASSTLTTNAETSPEGLQNATTLETTGTFAQIRMVSFGALSAGNQTLSVFAKYESSQYIILRNRNFTGGTNSQVWFDIQNGIKGGSTGDTPIDYDIEDYGNGWYRCYLVFNADAADLAGEIYLYNSNTDGSYNTGIGDTSIIWGFQLEEGSYPTSYIPNHSGGSVTREADVPSNASAASIIGQTEGTIFIDFLYESNPAGNRFSISDGTATNWIFIATPESGTSSRFYIRVNNSVIVDVGSSSYFVDGTRYKLALAYKSRDWAVYGNGTQLYVGTDNIPSFSSPMDTINFKSFNPSDAVTEKEKINQVLLFDTRISNGNLATLTS